MARAKRFGSGERIPAKTVRDTSSATPTYSYDANGNRTNPGDTVGTDNQISTDGTWTYTYDKEGNVTEKTDAAGDKWQYTYDNANELVGATYTPTGTTVASTICTYVYDVFGDKIEQEETVSGTTTITKFAYDGTNVWAAMSSTNALQTRYVYMDGSTTPVAQISSSGTVNWYDTDYEGSVRLIVSNTGSVVDTIKYDAYGNILSQSAPVSGAIFAYAGGMNDSVLQVDWFGIRVYNPADGTWLQQDPLFPDSGTDPYVYGGDDPSNETDPTGLEPNLPRKGPGLTASLQSQQVPGEAIIGGSGPGTYTVSPGGAGSAVTYTPEPDWIDQLAQSIEQVNQSIDALWNGANELVGQVGAELMVTLAQVSAGYAEVMISPEVGKLGPPPDSYNQLIGRGLGRGLGALQATLEMAEGAAMMGGGTAAAVGSEGVLAVPGAAVAAEGVVVAGHGVYAWGNVIWLLQNGGMALNTAPESGSGGGEPVPGEQAPTRPAPAADNYRGRYQADLHEKGIQRLPDDWDVHHRIPQEYIGDPRFKGFDFHSPCNLQGVQGSRSANNVHQLITNRWAEFIQQNPNATRMQIESFAEEIDQLFAEFWWR